MLPDDVLFLSTPQAQLQLCLKFCSPVLAGGAFDPLGLTADSDDRTFKLQTAEIKHARLAMVAFLGEPLLLVLKHDACCSCCCCCQ